MGEQYYFLGANTMNGFYSVYDSFTQPQSGDFLYILKGGSGCGKSSFMRKIGAAAQTAGLSVEYALCSGDPQSLDGVYIPSLKTAFVDGTAPHVLEPALCGADSAYLDLSRFYRITELRRRRGELGALYEENKACYKRAYAYLRCCGEERRRLSRRQKTDEEIRLILDTVSETAARVFPKSGRTGRAKTRFFTALTCQGHIALAETLGAICSEMIVLDNSRFLADGALYSLADAAVGSGCDVLVCPAPLDPQVLEAVLVPELSLAFVASDSPLAGESFEENYIFGDLLSQATQQLAAAKEAHDSLEAVYNPYIDFDGVFALCARHIAALGL